MLWHRETHINPQRNRWIIVDPAGIELTTSRLRQLRQLPVVQHVRFTPLKSRHKNATPMTCPWLRWTTDNPSGMHRCRFQHLCVLILNCALALAIYIFVGLILMLWHRETHINPQRNRWIIVDPAGIELTTSRLRQLRQLPVVQHVRFTPLKSRHKNATPMTCPWLRWTTDNPSGMHRCRFQHLCVLILNCALALAIYIFVGLILMLWHRETHINPQRNRWIIVDPAGIELTTSRLRQLRQLPVVQHVRFTPLKSRHKNATPMTCPWLRWTTDNPSGMHRCRFQHLCVLILNCALALAIYIFVGLILMLWHRETHINPQRNRWIIVDPAGIELTTSRLRQLRHILTNPEIYENVKVTPIRHLAMVILIRSSRPSVRCPRINGHTLSTNALTLGTTVPRRFRFHTRLKSIQAKIVATVTTNTTKFYSKTLSYWLPDHCRSFPDRANFQDVSTMLPRLHEPTMPMSKQGYSYICSIRFPAIRMQ